MDSTEDLSARVLVKHILNAEPPRTPLTRSAAGKVSSGTRRSSRLNQNNTGAQTPQLMLRRSLKHKIRESISSKAFPNKRRTASTVLKQTPGPTSMLFDDEDTPRQILKNILLTEPVKSPVINEKVVLQQPQPSPDSSLHSRRPSVEVSGLDLPDLTIGNIETTVNRLNRKRQHHSLNVTAFEKRLRDGNDVAEEAEESLVDPSLLSLSSSSSLSLKTPFNDVRTERKALQRKGSYGRKVSVEDFGAAIDKREQGNYRGLSSLAPGQALGETAYPEDFTLGLSKLSEPDISMDIVNCNTALYAKTDAAVSDFSTLATQDKPTVMASPIQRDMTEKLNVNEQPYIDPMEQDQDRSRSLLNHPDLNEGADENVAATSQFEPEKNVANRTFDIDDPTESSNSEKQSKWEEAAPQTEDDTGTETSAEHKDEAEDDAESESEQEPVVEQQSHVEDPSRLRPEEEGTDSQTNDEEVEGSEDDAEEEEGDEESEEQVEDNMGALEDGVEESHKEGEGDDSEEEVGDEEEEEEQVEAVEDGIEEVQEEAEGDDDAESESEQEPVVEQQSHVEDPSRLRPEEEGTDSQTNDEELEGSEDDAEEEVGDEEEQVEAVEDGVEESHEEGEGDDSEEEEVDIEEEQVEDGVEEVQEEAEGDEAEDVESDSQEDEKEQNLDNSEHITQKAQCPEGELIMPVQSTEADLPDSAEPGYSDYVPASPTLKDDAEVEADNSANKENAFQKNDSPDDVDQMEQSVEEYEEEEEEDEEMPLKTPAFVKEKRNFFNLDPQASPFAPSKSQPGDAGPSALGAKPKQKAQRKSGLQKSNPGLPKSYLMNVFKHFAKAKVSADVYPVLKDIMDKFLDRLAKDLEAYAQHARRSTIEVADCELLLRRQGYVNDKVPVEVLIEKYLRMDQRKLLIPIATSGNVVFPKKR